MREEVIDLSLLRTIYRTSCHYTLCTVPVYYTNDHLYTVSFVPLAIGCSNSIVRCTQNCTCY